METITLNKKQIRRAEILSQLSAGRITKPDAQRLLGLSLRQVNRILKGFEDKGLPSLIHGNSGRTPANKTSLPVYEKYGPVIYNSAGLIIEDKAERSGKGVSIIAEKIFPITTSLRNKDLQSDSTPYTERPRIAGQHSWTKGQGV